MTIVDPTSAASALSAPLRSATCSGVTSVAAVQSASDALVETGASTPVTVARKASASFWRADGLPFLGESVPAATSAQIDRQATRTAPYRIEARMPTNYLKR